MPRLGRRHAKRNAVLAVIAAVALVGFGWMLAQSRRDPRVVAVASAPRIVTVPVPIAVPEPPEPPGPTQVREPPPPGPRTQSRRAVAPLSPPAAQPPAAQAPPTTTPTQTDITTRYKQVGMLLKQHSDDSLWQRYRWIRLGDCLMTPEQRSECARMLDQIASDARGK